MKVLLTILFFFYISITSATQYYVGAGGNNSNNGTSIATRWLNVTKVNSSTFAAGDIIAFAGNEVFAGGLRIPSNGVIITSYGTGKAIISGLVNLSTWTSVGTNLWECTPSVTLKSTCNVLTVDGLPYAVGRTPNYNTFIPYQTANPSTITSSSLTGTPNYTGAELVIKKNVYSAEKVLATSQTGSTITYVATRAIDNSGSPTPQNGTNGYGFFIQRFQNSLDIQNEWYFNPTTNKMRMYSTTDPDGFTVKASYIDTVIWVGNHTNITITNITVEGGSLYGVYSVNGTNINITNNIFNCNTRAIYCQGGVNISVNNNVISNSFCNAMLIGTCKQVNILSNTVTNTGVFLGMGLFWGDYSLKGIGVRTDTTTISNFVNVIGNTVRNTGYMSLDFRGSNTIVRRNVIDTFCFQLDDGGGIYTWVSNSSVDNRNYANRFVDSNFVSNVIGAPEGTTASTVRGNGIYIDDQSKKLTITDNTVWNILSSGIIMNNPKDNNVKRNTVFNAGIAHKINMKPFGTISNNFVTRNIFYQKLTTQYNFAHINYNLSQPPPPITITQSLQGVAMIDTNWITNIKTNGYTYYYSTNGSGTTFPPDFNLTAWRSTYLHDIVSVLPPVPVTSTNTNLYTNPSSSLLVLNFPGFRKQDPKGVIYDNQATVGRWSSLILIDNGNSPQSGNIPPVANAGADILITLPTNSTSLSGSGSTDGDGTIVAYVWNKISGPASGTITTPNSVNTTLTSLTQGTYNFRLKVTDNIGDTSVDFVQVQVNAAPIPPVANAGADQTIQLPTNATTVSGVNSTDADGTITAWLWTKISGPTGGTVTSPTAMVTTITNMIAGVYVFSLRVTDNSTLTNTDFIQITVNAIVVPPNLPPVSDAGVDQIITLPTSTAILDGTASYDPDGTVVGYLWTKISGPTGGIIANPTNATSAVSGLTQGTYNYKLRVTDNVGDTSIDFMQVQVNAALIPPIANAGLDQTVQLPTNITTVSGGGSSDADGTIVSYQWAKISGPTGGTITSPTAIVTNIANMVEGTYTFSLTVVDNNSLSSTDFMQITVLPVVPPVNEPPVAEAGANQTITLPTSVATLDGTGSTDPDGTITGYLWRKISGPSGGAITSPTSATTGVTGLIAGVYIYQLRVIDNNGDSAVDAMSITVNAANVPPNVNAGADQSVQLPTSSTTLTGTATDVDGTISSVLWTKISGPTGGTIVSSTSLSTNITGLTTGQYIYQLRATDNVGDTSVDAVLINVLAVIPPVNVPPVSNAGPDQTKTLPTSTATLDGTGSTDSDGTITGYLWRKISGPSGGTITSSTSAITGVTGLIAGNYIYQLRVTDNSGDTSIDAMGIQVNAANVPPVVNAGVDQAFTLPTNSTTVTGTATDVDGTVSSVLWTKISGPTGGTITSATSLSTTITGLNTAGQYIFNLRATDNSGDTAVDAVMITVNPLPPLIPPVADAGIGQTIMLPTNSVTLTGIGTDQDGTIVSYSWVKILGGAATIVSPNSATTNVTGLVEDTYQFELTVTDNDALTGKDTIEIIVLPIPPNIPPVASAGGDIRTDGTIVTLNGSGSDQGGTIVSYVWTKISGPVGDVIVSPNSATTQVTGLQIGIYVYELTITDDDGATATSQATVTVVSSISEPVIFYRWKTF